MWGAGSRLPRQRGAGQSERGFARQLLSPKLPPEHGHVCVPFQYLPVSFPVKAFWLCVSVVPDSLGWVTCIRWAACQNPRDMASDRPCQASALPVLSEAGKTCRQECHARGKAAEPGEGCGTVPAQHQLLTSSALPRCLLGSGGGCVCPRQVPGSGMPHHTVTTAINHSQHTPSYQAQATGSSQTSAVREVRPLLLSITCILTAPSFPQRVPDCLHSNPHTPTPASYETGGQ